MAASVVPTNPYNSGESTKGPLPNLCEALKEDNRSQLMELLRLDPSCKTITTNLNHHQGQDNYHQGEEDVRPVTFRQRLIFSDRNIRNMILRHVLPDDNARLLYSKKKKSTVGVGGGVGVGYHRRDDDDVPPLPKGLGIVRTQCLMLDTNNNNSCFWLEDTTVTSIMTANNSSSSGPTMNVHDDGSAEVIFDKAASLASSVFANTNDNDFSDEPDVLVYFLRSDPMHARAVASNIHQAMAATTRANNNNNNNYHGIVRHRIVFLPHASFMCERILLDEGVLSLDNVTVHSLPIDWIPLDADILSLELSPILKDCDISGCPSQSVTTMAQSLLKLQDICGIIPRVQSLGPLGEAVVSKMISLRMEDDDYCGGDGETNPNNNNNNPPSEIPAILLLDRKVDLVTPMLTPLTYEGLLDEVLGIDSGFVTVDETILEPPDNVSEDNSKNPFGDVPTPKQPTTKVALPLNDTDTLYAEVRDQHVEKFGSFLQNQAKALKESHSNFTDNKKNRDLSEIHQFVKQIPIFTQNLRSLTNHIHLAELVKQTTEESEFRQRWQTERSMMESESCYDTLEDLISSQDPPFRLLRLLCLQSLTSGGIKSSRYDSLRREVVQTYGYGFLWVLQNFEKLGLLRRRETLWMDTASPFASLRKMLKLINAEVNTVEPDDFAYVSSGYAPISIRLVQAATQGWAGKEELLRELPGRLVDIQQPIHHPPAEDLATSLKKKTNKPTINLGTLAKSLSTEGGKKPVLLVFFIGGITFMEIAALRFLSKRPIFPYQIICCTTKIINGNTFLQSLA